MTITISPAKLKGGVAAVASKSCVHRLLICAALADGPCEVLIGQFSEDIEATIRCLTALGADIRRTERGCAVTPIDWTVPRNAVLDCGESGSTLRFLLPLAARLPEGSEARLEGHGRLPQRPNDALIGAMTLHGAKVEGIGLPLKARGPLRSGEYALPGNVSSQFVTGLLLTLPALKGDSSIRFTTEVESAGYICMTLSALALFGVTVHPIPGGYHIPGGQVFHSPGCVQAEGDWSNAAFWLAADALGSDVHVSGLDKSSAQGDRAILRVLEEMRGTDGRLRGTTIDAADIPDLVPVLSVAATQAEGVTRFINAGRLRVKECDRLAAMRENLARLGADIRETEDGLIVSGPTPLTGGEVNSFGDHRVAMSMAVAATVAADPVTILGAESVNKSYPGFFEEYERLMESGARLERA